MNIINESLFGFLFLFLLLVILTACILILNGSVLIKIGLVRIIKDASKEVWNFPLRIAKHNAPTNMYLKIILLTWQGLLVAGSFLVLLGLGLSVWLFSILLLCASLMTGSADLAAGLFFAGNFRWGFWHPVFHVFFEVLGYATSYGIYNRQKQVDVLTPIDRKTLKWWTLGGAIIGAKLIPILENINTPYLSLTLLLTGKSLAGGLLGGILGTEIGKQRAGIRQSTGDILVWPLLLGSLIGRLGCSSSAVTDGMLGKVIPENWIVNLPWHFFWTVDTAVSLQRSTKILSLLHLNRGIVWNIASLEIAGLLFITGLLFLLSKTKKLATGQLFYSFCLSYFVLRIGLETLKYIGEGIRVVSYISLTGVILSAWKGFQLEKSMTKSDKPKQT